VCVCVCVCVCVLHVEQVVRFSHWQRFQTRQYYIAILYSHARRIFHNLRRIKQHSIEYMS